MLLVILVLGYYFVKSYVWLRGVIDKGTQIKCKKQWINLHKNKIIELNVLQKGGQKWPSIDHFFKNCYF